MEHFSVVTKAMEEKAIDIYESLSRPPKAEKAAGKVDEKAAARLRTALEVMGAIDRPFELEA